MKKAPDTKRLLEALDTLKKQKGISMYQVAKKINYAPQSFSRIRSGGQNAPLKWIHKICDTYGINKNYIFNNEPPMFMDEKQGKIVEQSHVKDKAVKLNVAQKIPYYDAHLSAGMIKKFGDNVVNPAYFITIPYFVDCTLALRVSGDSMYPRYRSGDIVVCKHIHDKNLIMHGEPYVVITPDYCVVKYVTPHPTDKNKLVLKSENPKFAPSNIPKKDILQLYIIKGKIEVL
jgi:phage repressor protein C with HTH and peptisase S24 domain